MPRLQLKAQVSLAPLLQLSQARLDLERLALEAPTLLAVQRQRSVGYSDRGHSYAIYSDDLLLCHFLSKMIKVINSTIICQRNRTGFPVIF